MATTWSADLLAEAVANQRLGAQFWLEVLRAGADCGSGGTHSLGGIEETAVRRERKNDRCLIHVHVDAFLVDISI